MPSLCFMNQANTPTFGLNMNSHSTPATMVATAYGQMSMVL